jgi:lipopolysaccharide export system permease protein
MNTLRRFIYREVLLAVGGVSLAFLGLFYFFDVIDELSNIGKASPLNPQNPYELRHALLFVLLLVPIRWYELLPIAVLIGAVFVFARMAQGSEYTILRTSGLGPWRSLRMMLGLGVVFAGLTFALGDYVAPLSSKAAQLLKARYLGQVKIGQTGAWLKERQDQHQFAVNVAAMTDDGGLKGIRIFEFNDQGHLVLRLHAAKGQMNNGHWVLEQVERTDYAASRDTPTLSTQQLPVLNWATSLTAERVSVALLRPDRMGTLDLWGYVQHLDANGQTSQRYELEFWRKVFYPLSCLVMMVLALPFAYLHFRSDSITGYVFMGVMIGISFFLLNNVFGHIGRLNQWQPWLAAAAPSLIYSVMSLTAFGWLVLRR